jgi:hypothetical protein
MGHVAHMGEECTRFWGESPNVRDHMENGGLDKSMRSGLISGRLFRGWSGCSWLRLGSGGGLL